MEKLLSSVLAMHIDRDALPDLARGAAFLGSGGGGDPYHSLLLADATIRRRGAVPLIKLDELPDDALVVPCGWIGAPTVSIEKLPNGRENSAAMRRLEEVLGREINAVLPIEIGGANGLAPLITAAELGIPVVDCDGMGRAFPESQMTIFNIRGLMACPSVITGSCGALSVIETEDNLAHERIARSISVAMGGIAHMVEYPISGEQAKRHAIKGSITAAIDVGAAIRIAKERQQDPFEALARALQETGLYPHCETLFDGKIVDLHRDTQNGFSVGTVTVAGFADRGEMVIEFQNENLVATQDGNVRAMVPDLISIMDSETADTIATERLKYGQRVKVLGVSAPSMLRDAEALSVVGPGAFGLETEFVPVESIAEMERA